MPAHLGVEAPEGLTSAPAECQIQNVTVFKGPHVGAKIEGSSKKHQLIEGAPEFLIKSAQLGVTVTVSLVMVGHPQGKCGCEPEVSRWSCR
jgi:hypothetical protein